MPRRSSGPLPSDRWRSLEWAFWLTPAVCYFVFPGYLVLGSQVFITGLFALSLDLLLGYAGVVSLGHAAFFGAGAYSAGLLAAHGWGEPLSGVVAGAVAASLIGFCTSFLVVRGQDLTRLMVTLGIGLLLYEAANRAAGVTGGVDGLPGVVLWKLLGLFPFGIGGETSYWYSLVVVFLLFVLARQIVRSPFGLCLRGIREGVTRMPGLGVPVRRRLVAAFTISAALAGAAGALLAQTTQFVGIEALSFSRSAEVLVAVVLGGAGSLYGALVGATLLVLVRSALAGLDPAYWQLWLGVLLVGLVRFARGGALSAAAAGWRRLARAERP
ncbi:MAG: branched-chain amino acid ABC transporter permease [Myxococcales bacterium]|nr:branched-chain amino acid ABC transporter permease [Myxococcales bacterium]